MHLNWWEKVQRNMRESRNRNILAVMLFSLIISIQMFQRYINIAFGGSSWSWDVRMIWAKIAADVTQGTPLYVYPAVDNKPPLALHTTVELIQTTPRWTLLIFIAIANLLLALGVFVTAKRRYGYWIAVACGLLLIGALPKAGGLKYQPHNLAIAIIVFGILVSGSGYTGAALGLSSMLVQYGGLALPPMVLKVYRTEGVSKRTLTKFWSGFGVSMVIPFLSVWVLWGLESLRGALHWTFVAPVGYILGSVSAEPAYGTASSHSSPLHNPVYWADLVLNFVLQNVFLIIPAVGMSVFVLARQVNDEEIVDVVALACLSIPLLVRGFSHYWLFPLPFLCLLTGKFMDEVACSR